MLILRRITKIITIIQEIILVCDLTQFTVKKYNAQEQLIINHRHIMRAIIVYI